MKVVSAVGAGLEFVKIELLDPEVNLVSCPGNA
jgi:hypothetical protein